MISLASTAIYGLLKPFPTGGVGTADPKPWTSNEIDSSDGLRELAFKLNPAVGYWCANGITESDLHSALCWPNGRSRGNPFHA